MEFNIIKGCMREYTAYDILEKHKYINMILRVVEVGRRWVSRVPHFMDQVDNTRQHLHTVCS